MNFPRYPRQTEAFTFWELLIVIAVTGILLAVFLPALAKSKARSSRLSCTNHLKQIGLSFQQWALDNDDNYPMQVSATNDGAMEQVAGGNMHVIFLVMSNELNTPKVLRCPEDTSRTAATNWSSLRNSNLSYFVGLNATNTLSQRLLSGDDNFTINGKKPRSGVVSFATSDTASWLPTRHVNQGNVLLADGSVNGYSSVNLTKALQNTNPVTNRLMLP